MNLLVYAPGWAIWDGERLRCALGRGGIRADKREGDGATPAGSWPMRRLLYRPDRLPAPAARLAANPIAPQDGGCGDPPPPASNPPVRPPPAPAPAPRWAAGAPSRPIRPPGLHTNPAVRG